MRDRRKFLVIEADDLGLQRCFNAGVLTAAKNGILTSACLRANGLALEEAVSEILPQIPGLGIGAHICLNEGPALAPAAKSSLLAGGPGNSFSCTGISGFIRLWALRSDRALRAQVELEMRAQIEALMKRVSLDHLNGHMHVHAIPWIFEKAAALACEYGIPYIRLPREPFVFESLRLRRPSALHFAHYLNMRRWAPKLERCLGRVGLKSNDFFFGLLHSSFMSAEVSRVLLSAAERPGIVEMLYHPAAPAGDAAYICGYMKDFCAHPGRQEELSALLSADLKRAVSNSGYELTNYRSLSQAARPVRRGPRP